MRKYRWLILVLASLLVAEGGCGKPPSKPGGDELIPHDKLKEDLDFLFRSIDEVHPDMYAYISEKDFAHQRKALYDRLADSMTRLDFYKLVAPLVASLRDSHTFVRPFVDEYKDYVANGGKLLPLAFRVDGDSLVVSDNYGQDKLPVGSMILELGGEAANKFVHRISRRFPSHCSDANPALLERSQLLPIILWMEFGPINRLPMKIQMPTGKVRNHIVESMPETEMLATIDQKKVNAYQLLRRYKTGLIRLNNWGKDVEEFNQFLRTTFQQLNKDAVRTLVIDLRRNPGGDARRVKALMDYLTDQPYRLFEERRVKLSAQCRFYRNEVGPSVYEKGIGSVLALDPTPVEPSERDSLFRGRVFVLIGPRSTSASTTFAAAVQHYKIGTLVGEETGDTRAIFGGCFPIILPHSHLRIDASTEYLIMAGGREDKGPVKPEYTVRQNALDGVKGNDMALQFTLDLIHSQEGSNRPKPVIFVLTLGRGIGSTRSLN